MNLAIMVQALPYILQLVQYAEQFFKGEKRGDEKKQFVKDIVTTTVEGAKVIGSEKTKELAKELDPVLDVVINYAASELTTDKS